MMSKKCPRCGSKKTAEIIYGYPIMDDEMQQKLASGEWALGGCCVGSVEVNGKSVDIMPTRRCPACKKDFGKAPILLDRKKDTAEDYRDIVTAIRFFIGGYFGGATEVQIQKNELGALVKVAYYRTDDLPVDDRQIAESEWKVIVEKLYAKLYLHEWKKSFKDYDVLDGTQWELEISLTGRRKRSYSGSNAYPAYWKELLKIFRAYARITE